MKISRRLLITLTLVFLLSTTSNGRSSSGSGIVNINELIVSNYKSDYLIGIPAAREPRDDEISLTIEDLMDIAFIHNRMIEVVRQKVAQSEGQLTQARSGYLPHVSVQGRYFYTERQDSGANFAALDSRLTMT